MKNAGDHESKAQESPRWRPHGETPSTDTPLTATITPKQSGFTRSTKQQPKCPEAGLLRSTARLGGASLRHTRARSGWRWPSLRRLCIGHPFPAPPEDFQGRTTFPPVKIPTTQRTRPSKGLLSDEAVSTHDASDRGELRHLQCGLNNHVQRDSGESNTQDGKATCPVRK